MTTVRASLVVGTLAALGVFGGSLRARVLLDAQEAVAVETRSLQQTGTDLVELAELRSQREVVAAAKRPTNDVIAQVNAVLRDAGIPSARLKALEPEADVTLAGRYRSQTLRFALERLSLPEIGSLLSIWRAAETVWIPRSIELTHATSPDGSSLGYDTRIVIAATYLSDLAPETPR